MARKRMLDPSLFDNEKVAKLTVFSRYVFIGMISNADDEGKGRANPNYLKSVIFPYDNVRAAEVDKALSEISQNTSVQIYLVEGQKYYKFKHWNKWQKVEKPSKSMIPEPFPEDSPNPPRTLDDDSRLREEKRKEENIYTPSDANASETETNFFQTTWQMYPRKLSKEHARKTYEKKLLSLSAEEKKKKANQIYAALLKQMKLWEEEEREPKFIPHFATWLNDNFEDCAKRVKR